VGDPDYRAPEWPASVYDQDAAAVESVRRLNVGFLVDKENGSQLGVYRGYNPRGHFAAYLHYFGPMADQGEGGSLDPDVRAEPDYSAAALLPPDQRAALEKTTSTETDSGTDSDSSD